MEPIDLGIDHMINLTHSSNKKSRPSESKRPKGAKEDEDQKQIG
jgi:hypothetical protein